jgi:hypothetical protein
MAHSPAPLPRPQGRPPLERTPERCRQVAVWVGPATYQVVATLLPERTPDRVQAA